jgi:hypothetical protein
MKRMFLNSTLILFLCCTASIAQKLDLDKEILSHNYIKLPSNSDLANLKTYSVTMYANMSNLQRLGVADKIEAAVKLDGFVYVTGLADVKIEITIEDLKKLSEDVETKETQGYQNPGGAATKTYIATTSYLVPTSFKVFKALSNDPISQTEFGTSSKPVVVSMGEFPNQAAAQAALKGSEEKKLEKLKETYLNVLISQLNNFKERFDFKLDNETDAFWRVDLKKNPEYAEFNEKLATVKQVFGQAKAYDDLKGIHEKLDPIMQNWRENVDKVPASEKKSKKKYLYLINLAKTQYWLDMADECAITSQQIIDNDYDKVDGKTYLKLANSLKEDLNKSPNGTRHFMRDGFTSTGGFKANEIQPIPFKLPNPPAGFRAYPGTMVNVLGEKHKGVLWVKATGVISFEPKEGTRFVYDKNGEVAEQAIDLTAIEEITLTSGEKFARFKHENTKLFFQILHETGSHKILQYLRSNEGAEATGAIVDFNNGKELSLLKIATGKIYSVGGLIEANVAKRTAEFYGTCEAAKTKILAGELGKMNDLEGQIKALNFFEQNCK